MAILLTQSMPQGRVQIDPNRSSGSTDLISPSNRMWNWIEHTLEDSEDFNFLFVAGHYMTIDSRGIYDRSDIEFFIPLLYDSYGKWFIHNV